MDNDDQFKFASTNNPFFKGTSCVNILSTGNWASCLHKLKQENVLKKQLLSSRTNKNEEKEPRSSQWAANARA